MIGCRHRGGQSLPSTRCDVEATRLLDVGSHLLLKELNIAVFHGISQMYYRKGHVQKDFPE